MNNNYNYNNQSQNIEQQPQQPNNNGKKKKGPGVIIFILAVALAVSVGYILGNNVFSKAESDDKQNNTENKGDTPTEDTNPNDSTKPTEDTTPTENTTPAEPDYPKISDKEAMEKGKELINTLLSFEYRTNDMALDKMATYTNNSIVNAKDLDNEIVYQIIMNKFYSNNPKEITLDDFNSNVKKVFDDSFTFTPKDYSKNCSGNLYKYDSANKKYTKITAGGGCGGIGDDWAPYKIYSAGTENGNIILEVQVIFGKNATDSDGVNSTVYYSDYNKTKKIDGANSENYKDYLYLGTTYKFTFKYSNGDYVFVKAEKEA